MRIQKIKKDYVNNGIVDYIEINNPQKELFDKGYRIYGGDAWETFEDVKKLFDRAKLTKDSFIVKVNSKIPWFAIAEKEHDYTRSSLNMEKNMSGIKNYTIEIELEDEDKIIELEFSSLEKAINSYKKYSKSNQFNRKEIADINLIKNFNDGDSEPIDNENHLFKGYDAYADGGSVSNIIRMYNFLKDDLSKLEEAIKDGDNEEIERFFSYWLGSSGHLKSLYTINNQRMYMFLNEDLNRLKLAIEDDDTEEIERFFSYWGQHLVSIISNDIVPLVQNETAKIYEKNNTGFMGDMPTKNFGVEWRKTQEEAIEKLKKEGKLPIDLKFEDIGFRDSLYENGGSFAPNVSDGTQFMSGVYAKGGKLPKKNTPEYHQYQIAKDTIKNQIKGDLMGGMTLEEAKKIVSKYDNGGMFDDNDGFMKADNNRNFRYPEKEVIVQVLNEDIDLNDNVSYFSKEVYIQPLNEDIGINEIGRVKATLGYVNKNRTPAKLLDMNPRAAEYVEIDEMAEGGSVIHYPSFTISKGTPYLDSFLNPGYYSYLDKERGGKGVYMNVMNKQIMAFSIDDLKIIKEKYPNNISISLDSMAKGGYLEGREEYEGYNYQIWYNPNKRMYSVSDEIGIFKGDNNYFTKFNEAKEHAKISIRSMLMYEEEMAKGGTLKKREIGRYKILGEIKGQQPILYASTNDRDRIKYLVDMAKIDLNELTGKKHHIFVTDGVTDDEVFNYAEGGSINDDFIVFSIDDEKLDMLLHDFHSRDLDYVDINGDEYYKLNRRDFDRFIDAADSNGFDVDYDNSEDSVVYVENNYAKGGGVGEKVTTLVYVNDENTTVDTFTYEFDSKTLSGIKKELKYLQKELSEDELFISGEFMLNDKNYSFNTGEVEEIEDFAHGGGVGEKVTTLVYVNDENTTVDTFTYEFDSKTLSGIKKELKYLQKELSEDELFISGEFMLNDKNYSFNYGEVEEIEDFAHGGGVSENKEIYGFFENTEDFTSFQLFKNYDEFEEIYDNTYGSYSDDGEDADEIIQGFEIKLSSNYILCASIRKGATFISKVINDLTSTKSEIEKNKYSGAIIDFEKIVDKVEIFISKNEKDIEVTPENSIIQIFNKGKIELKNMANGGGVGDMSELDAEMMLKDLKKNGQISQLSVGNHGLIFMSVKGGQLKSYESYKDAYSHYLKSNYADGGGVGYNWSDPRIKELTDKLSRENKNDVVRVVLNYQIDKNKEQTLDKLRELGAKYSRENDNETARNISEIFTILQKN